MLCQTFRLFDAVHADDLLAVIEANRAHNTHSRWCPASWAEVNRVWEVTLFLQTLLNVNHFIVSADSSDRMSANTGKRFSELIAAGSEDRRLRFRKVWENQQHKVIEISFRIERIDVLATLEGVNRRRGAYSSKQRNLPRMPRLKNKLLRSIRAHSENSSRGEANQLTSRELCHS